MKMFGRLSVVVATLLVITLIASGCSPKGGSTTVKELSGAGATFPYPLYSKMFDTYTSTTGVRVNYNIYQHHRRPRQLQQHRLGWWHQGSH